jgi:hypothetical protein
MEQFKVRDGGQNYELRNKYNELVDFVGKMAIELIALKSKVEVQSNGSEKEESGITKDAESRDTSGSAEPKRKVNRSPKK